MKLIAASLVAQPERRVAVFTSGAFLGLRLRPDNPVAGLGTGVILWASAIASLLMAFKEASKQTALSRGVVSASLLVAGAPAHCAIV